MVGYTPSAAAASGDIASLINLAIAETNTSFTLSGVNAQVRLVGTMQVSYTESGKSYDTITNDWAGTSIPAIAAAHAQRDALHADIAVLIINQSDYCGEAAAIGATAANAFDIVHYSCATGYYSFGHEMGHLMGARHDLVDNSTSTPFSYGHGYQYRTSPGWRTIMSYRCTDGSCDPRLQYWSSPSLTHNGHPMGSAASENNVAVWNARAATVAAFR